MSRSYYHTPRMGITGRRSCKKWRQQENQRYRKYVKGLLIKEKYDDIVAYKGKWGNEWDSPRDGKFYFGHYKNVPCIPVLPHEITFYWSGRPVRCSVEKNYHWCHKEYKRMMRK